MKTKGDKWTFFGSSPEGRAFKIEGVNVWETSWESQHLSVEVTDPLYGAKREFSIFKITEGSKEIEFVAGEFSNCMWGFYVKQK